MNFLLIMILLITHQQNATAHSLSELVQLYHYAEGQIQEIQSIVRTLMESVAVQQKKVVNEMYNQCLSYVNVGLQKLEPNADYDTQSKIYSCSQDINATIDTTTEQYLTLLDESEDMLAETIKRLQKEPFSDDLDDINDEIDDIIDDFKEMIGETINPAVESLLRKVRMTSISLPLKVKECVDEVLK